MWEIVNLTDNKIRYKSYPDRESAVSSANGRGQITTISEATRTVYFYTHERGGKNDL